MKKNRFKWFALPVAALLLTVGTVQAQADTLPDSEITESAPVQQTIRQTLYFVQEKHRNVISLPSGYTRSFQLPAGCSYQVLSEKSTLEIDRNGVVKPGAGFYLFDDDPAYYEGETTVLVQTEDRAVRYIFDVVDYGVEVEAPKRLKQLEDEYVPEGASAYEILVAAAKIANNEFDYQLYQEWQDVVLLGGGDCIGGSAVVGQICKDYGIPANVRFDAGGVEIDGTGHRNLIARIGGDYYIVEAGSPIPKPRYKDGWSVQPATASQIRDYRGNYYAPYAHTPLDGRWVSGDQRSGTVPGGSNPGDQPSLPDPSQPSGGSVDMYRLYNPNSGEHFYTASTEERDHLAALGWKFEGIGWTAPQHSSDPVYRLYNPNAGDHHYTISPEERTALIQVGWKDEGIGWYSDENKGTVLYREYNPNARSGAHNYTTSSEEHIWLCLLGWMDEGNAWYGL